MKSRAGGVATFDGEEDSEGWVERFRMRTRDSDLSLTRSATYLEVLVSEEKLIYTMCFTLVSVWLGWSKS